MAHSTLPSRFTAGRPSPPIASCNSTEIQPGCAASRASGSSLISRSRKATCLGERRVNPHRQDLLARYRTSSNFPFSIPTSQVVLGDGPGAATLAACMVRRHLYTCAVQWFVRETCVAELGPHLVPIKRPPLTSKARNRTTLKGLASGAVPSFVLDVRGDRRFVVTNVPFEDERLFQEELLQ